MSDNYYNILGISENADDNEIKRAYKKLLKMYHPDIAGASEENNKMMSKINEAKSILLDPEKRKIYDQYGEEGLRMQENMGDNDMGGFPFGFGGGFEDIFGRRNRGPNIENCEVNLKMDLKDLVNGFDKDIHYERLLHCDTCNGTGAKNKKSHKCKKCNGKGVVNMQINRGPFMQIARTECENCKGTGNEKIQKNNKCKDCKGDGKIQHNELYKLSLEPGSIYEGSIQIRNKGNETYVDGNKIISNLVIHISYNPDDNFEIINEVDLYHKLELTLEESLGGFTKRIKLLDNTHIIINETNIVNNGKIIIIENKGLYNARHKNKGNLYIEYEVKLPKQNKQLMKNLYKIITDNKSYTAYENAQKELMMKHKNEICKFKTYDKNQNNNHNKNNKHEQQDCKVM